MPAVVGNRKNTADIGRGYLRDPISKYAKAFVECASDILEESSVDMFSDIGRALQYNASMNALKNFFVEDTLDTGAISALEGDEWADEAIQEQTEALEEQFLNDREGVLNEYANLGTMNPVVGMSFPLHKWILMNNIFDKGAIPKVVAREPKFTMTLETRYLVKPDGTEIDMFKEQYKMTAAMNDVIPNKEVEINLPENEVTNVLNELKTSYPDSVDLNQDHLSIETYISAVKVGTYFQAKGTAHPETGEIATSDTTLNDVYMPVKLNFVMAYGEYDRTMTEGVEIPTGRNSDGSIKFEKDVISGYRTKKDMFGIYSFKGLITSVKLMARIDTSRAMFDTCSVKWDTTTTLEEIPDATPINVPISPEEIKDVAALYNVNQLSKIMSMIKIALGNYKDDMIKQHLDESFVRLPASQKVETTFDFAPERDGYAFSHVQWRKETFMDYLDHVTTIMLQVLNDPNMTISVFGSPELVRMVTPTEYTYQAPSNIGPVELDFSRTIVTSDKRVYQFIGSDKLRGTTNFILVLCPRNSERIIYRIYDYQMYISNEIRNKQTYTLPAVHAFERWKFVEYQPVQGRVQILHPTGLRNIAANDSPIQPSSMNDFNLIAPQP